MSDKICSSADKVLEVFLENAPMDTSHHRMVKQQNKCGYGLQGVCCRLCSNGPCRLSPAKPKGVCGADADTIACRNFLRQVAAGSGYACCREYGKKIEGDGTGITGGRQETKI